MVECGTRAELLAAKGCHAELYRTQFAHGPRAAPVASAVERASAVA